MRFVHSSPPTVAPWEKPSTPKNGPCNHQRRRVSEAHALKENAEESGLQVRTQGERNAGLQTTMCRCSLNQCAHQDQGFRPETGVYHAGASIAYLVQPHLLTQYGL